MAIKSITFTEWTPDQPSIVENLSYAYNVVPAAVGYTPFPSAVDYSDAASEDLNSVFAGRFSSTTNVFAGGATKLFKFDSTDLSMDNVSKSGNYTNIEKWNFVQFGNTVIAANNLDKLQGFTLGSSTVFADLAVNAPVAKYVTVVRDFVVAANLDSGTNANKVQWSDINDESDWTSGATSQSDYQVIADGGNIRGITGGEFGLVLLDRAIVRMTYIGSPFFFQFDTIAKGLGCVEGNSVTKYGNITYFLGEEGFYSCDGQTITSIGNEKIDRWFWSNANISKLPEMSATVDSFRKIVVWNFETTFAKRGLLIYNWQVQKWSYGETDAQVIATSASAGATLEGLDINYIVDAGSFVVGKEYTIAEIGTTDFTLIGASANTVGLRFTATGAGSGTGNAIDLAAAAAAGFTLETMTTSLDSPLYTGGKTLFAGAVGGKVVTFTGQPSSAQIDTGYIGSQYNSTILLARPLVDNGSASVAVKSINLLNQVVDYGSYVDASSENRVSLRSNGKYHSLSIRPTGAQWSNALGVDIEIVQQGTR
jgi:hypothetical protein